MSLYVDKHRPVSLEKTTFHPELTERLRALVASNDIPHLLFYGPSGAGKKTRVVCLLRELFGVSATKVRVEHRVFKNNSTSIDLTMLTSNHHIEMNPSDVGMHDRVVVQQVIKEIAQSVPLDAGAGRIVFKVVVLNEVDKLTREAQQALRRTMEKYSATTRLILVCNSTSKVIEPIRSRCLPIRVPAPTLAEVGATLRAVAAKEALQVPEPLFARIAEASERNMRRALLMLEAAKVEGFKDAAPPLADWERFIGEIVRDVMEEQSPQRLLVVRNKVYELLANCIPPEVIMRRLTLDLMRKIDAELKAEVAHWAAFYEHRMVQGSKVIFHIEAFLARFMALYKRFVQMSFAMD
jgi:replication factor C subunit 3/5